MIAAYLLAVALVFSVVSVLCSDSTVAVRSAEPGVTDLTGFDFDNSIAEVATESTESIFIYLGMFYTPEDFAGSSVTQKGVLYGHGAVSQGDFGTLRLVLWLPAGEVYAISGKSVSYALVREAIKDIKRDPKVETVCKYNSKVLGMQNYYKIACNVNADFNRIGYDVHKMLYNRLHAQKAVLVKLMG